MNTADLDFHLPPDLIAQMPAPRRPASRLLHYRRSSRSIDHRAFADLPSLLHPGDLLVFNNAKVVPARFTLIKPTGGRIEGLFVSQTHPRQWRVLLKNVGPWTSAMVYRVENAPVPASSPSGDRPGEGETHATPEGDALQKGDRSLPPHANALPTGERELAVRLLAHQGEGEFTLGFDHDTDAIAVLERIGRMPLPPYIKRDKRQDERDAFDRDRYQTVYADVAGSVAAPTAGLHFDDAVLSELAARGIERAFVTLHVGMGTFKPVTADTLEGHTMHVERYTIDASAAEQITRAKRQGRRVIAVGTTAARVLESQPEGAIEPRSGETGIFIYPPYRWKWVDALVTNFHLPRSTLIALVAAFVGLDEQRRIYAEAIAQRYRFFSYGDSSFLE